MNKKYYTILHIYFLLFQAKLKLVSGPNISQKLEHASFWIVNYEMKQSEKGMLWEIHQLERNWVAEKDNNGWKIWGVVCSILFLLEAVHI